MPISGKNPGDTIGNDDVRTSVDAELKSIGQRQSSLVSIWANPDAGAGGTDCTRTQQWPASKRIIKYPEYKGQTAEAPTGDGTRHFFYDLLSKVDPKTGELITATNQNEHAGMVNTVVGIQNILPGYSTAQDYGVGTVSTVSVGDQINASDITNLATQWQRISTLLDAYSYLFDSNNLCARSCQVSCQTACQTSCQGCNVSQCHNQKCGVH